MFYINKLRNYLTFCRLYAKGIMRENLAEYKESLHYLFLALSMNTKSLKCYKAIARVYRKHRQYYYAIDFYCKAIEKFPHCAELYAQRADIHRKLKEYDLALQDYDRAIKNDYSNIEYYKKRAQIKYYTNDIQGAANDITSTLSWKKDYKLYQLRGFYRLENKSYESAYSDFSEAIKLNNKSAHAYYMRYVINEFLNNKEEAKIDKEQAFKLNEKLNS